MELDIFSVVIVPLLVGIVPAIISFYSARHQATKSLETEIKKIQEQHKLEMEKLKAEYDAEIQKQSFEMEKLKTEIEKQAELYEKNTQSDIAKDIFGQMLAGNNVLENLANGIQDLEKIQRNMKQGKYHSNNKHHSIKRKK